MNRKALLIAAASAAVGLALLLMYQERFKREASGGQMVPILVATEDINLGELLSERKLGVRNVPEAYVDERCIRQSDLSHVLGVRVSMGVHANQTVLWTDLATSSDARRDLSSLVRAPMRAVTIRADATSTFGGLIRPGDRVDVLTTMARTGGEGDRITLPLLQNVLVLAAGRDTGGEAAAARNPNGTNAGSADTSSQVTVSTTMQEAEILVFAQDRGRLSLVLRNPEDVAVTADLPPATMDDIIHAPSARVHATAAASAPPPAHQGIEVIHSNGGN